MTGAGGFVGRMLTQKALSTDYLVTAAFRTHPPPATHPRLRLVRVGEIDGSTDWDDALKGVTTIVHAAGRAHVMRDRVSDPLGEFRRVNTEGTRRLAESATRRGVRRLVFVSSVKVNGERTGRAADCFRETDVPRPNDPYGISKLEAETALAEIAARSQLEVVVVRPPLVFGPGVKANFLALIRWIDRGLPIPLGAVSNRRSVVSVWNLVDLLLLCTRHEAAAGEVFLASDARCISTAELVRGIASALGRPARLVPVPPLALRLAATATGRSEQIRRLCDSLEVDASKAHRVLNWFPHLSLEEGLLRTVSWYRDAHTS